MTRSSRFARVAVLVAAAWATGLALVQPVLDGHAVLAIFLVCLAVVVTIGA